MFLFMKLIVRFNNPTKIDQTVTAQFCNIFKIFFFHLFLLKLDCDAYSWLWTYKTEWNCNCAFFVRKFLSFHFTCLFLLTKIFGSFKCKLRNFCSKLLDENCMFSKCAVFMQLRTNFSGTYISFFLTTFSKYRSLI